MDYRRIYGEFIADRLAAFPDKGKHPDRERHHIVPKCMGGGDDEANLVSLTYSDHIFAHLLLAKIYGGKLAIAFGKMVTVPRYQGRHTRLTHAAVIAEARRAKGDGRRGTTGSSPAHKAAMKEFNAKRRGQPASPALIAARIRQGAERRGKPAHPKALEAISRTGSDRSEKQRARDVASCAKMRAGWTDESRKKTAAKLRGRPWSEARRDAHDFGNLLKFAFAMA